MRCGERWIVTSQSGQRDRWMCTMAKTTRRGTGLLEFRVYITYPEILMLRVVVTEMVGVLWFGWRRVMTLGLDADRVRSRRPRDSGTDLSLKAVWD